MLTYCFESTYVPRTLARCRKNDLAVVDTEGHEKAVREAVSRGVWVYGYLNVGALKKASILRQPVTTRSFSVEWAGITYNHQREEEAMAE